MKVYIQKGKDEIETTIKILERVKPKIGKKVLIKPNLTMPISPKVAICTSPKVVEGIIIYLKSLGIDDIIIGEGAGGIKDMSRIFEVTGYKELADKYSLPLVNLNKDERAELTIKNGNYLKKITIARNVINRYIINVPKMKTHRMAVVSLAMKNMMGGYCPIMER